MLRFIYFRNISAWHVRLKQYYEDEIKLEEQVNTEPVKEWKEDKKSERNSLKHEKIVKTVDYHHSKHEKFKEKHHSERNKAEKKEYDKDKERSREKHRDSDKKHHSDKNHHQKYSKDKERDKKSSSDKDRQKHDKKHSSRSEHHIRKLVDNDLNEGKSEVKSSSEVPTSNEVHSNTKSNEERFELKTNETKPNQISSYSNSSQLIPSEVSTLSGNNVTNNQTLSVNISSGSESLPAQKKLDPKKQHILKMIKRPRLSQSSDVLGDILKDMDKQDTLSK